MKGALRIGRWAVGLLLYLFIMGCGGDNNFVLPQWGIGVVNFNQGWIGIINPATQTVTTPFLVNELGTSGGGLFDVVITPDRSTAIISNFGDSTVFFVDIRNPAAPAVLGSVVLTFFAEDIALTPNGKYALVTDGGFEPSIAVLDVVNRTLVEEYVDPVNSFNSVAVGADGQTVLAADYSAAMLHVLTIDAAGHLTFVNSIDVSNGQTIGLSPFFRPVNVSISPDGKTAILAGTSAADAAAVPPTVEADNMVFPVLQITAPGVVALNGLVAPNKRIKASQSIVFSPYGNKAYALCVQEGGPTAPPAPILNPTNAVLVMDVTAPGTVVSPGTAIVVNNVGTSQLFGVDTLAIDPYGHFLYVSNMTMSGAINQLQVLDVTNNTMAKVITFDQVENPPGGGAPALKDALPAGVFIR